MLNVRTCWYGGGAVALSYRPPADERREKLN